MCLTVANTKVTKTALIRLHLYLKCEPRPAQCLVAVMW